MQYLSDSLVSKEGADQELVGTMRYYRINRENQTSSTSPPILSPQPRHFQPRLPSQIYMPPQVAQTPLPPPLPRSPTLPLLTT